ncbi:MAG TPA: ATP-binding protein [Syntrophorhabdaceae bacterium]|nr:ATP-binding protein [Syntrophorhabdaceae bacterium]
MPIEDSEESSKPETSEQALKEIRMRKMNIGPRYFTASRENITPNLWSAFEGFPKGESYFVSGPTGVGKTCLTTLLMCEYNRGKMVNMAQMLRRIKASYNGDLGESEFAVMRDLSEMPCLVLDDIGVEKTNDWVFEKLYELIDDRHRNLRQTVFTSNLSLQQLMDKWGERIPSRIAEMCGPHNVIYIPGTDRRMQKIGIVR